MSIAFCVDGFITRNSCGLVVKETTDQSCSIAPEKSHLEGDVHDVKKSFCHHRCCQSLLQVFSELCKMVVDNTVVVGMLVG